MKETGKRGQSLFESG